jgi:hypothetical protein
MLLIYDAITWPQNQRMNVYSMLDDTFSASYFLKKKDVLLVELDFMIFLRIFGACPNYSTFFFSYENAEIIHPSSSSQCTVDP